MFKLKDNEILPFINIFGQLELFFKVFSYDYLVKQHIKFLCCTITPMFKQLEKKSEDWTSSAIFFLQLSDLPIDFKQSVSNMNIYSMQASLS